MTDTRQATDEELADELIRILVDLVTDEPEMVGSMNAAGRSPWDMVQAWCLVNNCSPLLGLDRRLRAALGESDG